MLGSVVTSCRAGESSASSFVGKGLRSSKMDCCVRDDMTVVNAEKKTTAIRVDEPEPVACNDYEITNNDTRDYLKVRGEGELEMAQRSSDQLR